MEGEGEGAVLYLAIILYLPDRLFHYSEEWVCG